MDFTGSPPTVQDPEPSLLIKLPEELWGLILKKVLQKDALSLRLVGKDFKQKVNNLFEDWKIEIDENSPYLEMILDLRVKEIKIHSLHKTPSFRPPGVLLKYPNLIQKLTLSSPMALSTQNEHILLQSKNLKHLDLQICNGPLDPQMGYNYPDLHTLKLDIKISEGQQEPLQPDGLVQRIMMHSRMPKLTSFQVNFQNTVTNDSKTIYKIASLLLSFLGREGENLKQFIYENSRWGDYLKTRFPSCDDSIVLRKMKSLKYLKLTPLWMNDPLYQTWEHLILNQRTLVNMYFDFNCRVPSIFLRKIAENNYQTLTFVHVEGLTKYGREIGEDKKFDVSIFQNCPNLISLDVNAECYSCDHELANMRSLPKKIQTVEFNHFTIDSEDMVEFLTGHPHLSNFMIFADSVDVSVLQTVLTHEALLYASIGAIDIEISATKLAGLNKIYSKLGCKKVKGQFDFDPDLKIKRASLVDDWKAVDA